MVLVFSEVDLRGISAVHASASHTYIRAIESKVSASASFCVAIQLAGTSDDL